MDGSKNDRGSRRNDSVSSVMSFTTESPTWARQSNNEEAAAAPAAPRDTRAKLSRASYHKHESMEHDSHMAGHMDHDQSQSTGLSHGHITPTGTDTTEITDIDIMHSIYQLLEQLPGQDDVDLVDAYQRAAPLPPITQESLKELEVTRIISNPKLRHDVNFDKELHFRPNLDGSRGKNKLKAADEYWNALTAELELYRAIGNLLIQCQDAKQFRQLSRMMKASQIRMPGMFETIKEILKTLVPGRDQSMIDERLEVPMIMQQISNGVFNLMDLALWLAMLLKAHCAPMRDDWVDQMVAQTSKGVEEGCQKRIVLSLRQTLGILEAMKLDVANHQIRHLRAMLIEDTANFQQRYYLNRLHQGRLEVKRARMWYKREASHLLACDASTTPLEIFTSALLRSLLSQSPINSLPETFQLDMERLRGLRNDLSNLIQLDICCDLFDDLLVRSNLSKQAMENARGAIRAAIIDIVGESRRFIDNVGNIAAEIVRTALVVEGAAVDYNSELADFVEKQLRSSLQTTSLAYATRVQNLNDETLPVLFDAIKTNCRLSLLALHETMLPTARPTTPLTLGLSSQVSLRPQQEALQEIVRRATHLGVLHWHIWSPIVYNIRDEESQPLSSHSSDHHGEPSNQTAIATGQSSSAITPSTLDTQAQTRDFINKPSESSLPPQ